MNKYLRGDIEKLLKEYHRSSEDNHGFVMLPASLLDMLQQSFNKDCRKHGKKPVRPEVAA
jgi:hypothetical protein